MECLKGKISSVSVLLAISLSIGIQASGAEKQRIFEGTYDAVWNACVRAANQEFTLEHSEKESGVLSFRTGASLASWGFRVGVTVTQVDDKTVKVVLNPQKVTFQFAWGAGDRIVAKYFRAVHRNLFDKEK